MFPIRSRASLLSGMKAWLISLSLSGLITSSVIHVSSTSVVYIIAVSSWLEYSCSPILAVVHIAEEKTMGD